jgi:hypothetical protein
MQEICRERERERNWRRVRPLRKGVAERNARVHAIEGSENP